MKLFKVAEPAPNRLSKNSQQTANQQNEQDCTKSYARTPACAPATVTIVSSSSTDKEHQNNNQYDEHLRPSSPTGM